MCHFWGARGAEKVQAVGRFWLIFQGKREKEESLFRLFHRFRETPHARACAHARM